MPGRNLFEAGASFAVASSPCVFISYRRVDLDEAKGLAAALLAAGINIYFDENDECLNGASEDTDPERVLECIESGLRISSHLLGIVTSDTRGSWWVPYEIGATRFSRKECAFLIDPGVDKLPAYMRVSTILQDRKALRNWLPSLRNTAGVSGAKILQETLDRLELTAFPKFMPSQRDLSDITFY